jgi:ABC-type polar amino acid transport system ATPase subunit
MELLGGMSRTMLVSTHDMRMVDELFARTVVMDHGTIINPEAVRSQIEGGAWMRWDEKRPASTMWWKPAANPTLP